MPPTPDEFLEALRAAVVAWGGAEWLADRIDGDAIVVLFRQELVEGSAVVPGPIEGTRLRFDVFAAEVAGPGAHRLEDVLGEAVLEIVEPHESGTLLEVPWADGLCDDPGAVLWRPDAVASAAESGSLGADRAVRRTRRSLFDEPQWRSGAMRPEERERLVRIGLHIVLGTRASALRVHPIPNDSIFVTEGTHGFGFPPDEVLGDDPRVVLEHDVERLVDELCETQVAWAEQLPVCPLHPGAHTLEIVVGSDRISAICPSTGSEIRSSSY